MIVATFKFYETGNRLETETILANSKEEAEEYLRTMKRDGSCKKEELNIEHSYVVGNATKFSIFSRNEDGEPLVLDWKGEDLKDSGRVKYWTELPKNLKKGKICI